MSPTPTIIHDVDQWFNNLSTDNQSRITSIMVLGDHELHLQLTATTSSIVIVCTSPDDLEIVLSSFMEYRKVSFSPYLLTIAEAEELAIYSPLEFFAFRESYSLFFGVDYFADKVLLRDIHLSATIIALRNTIFQLRNASLLHNKRNGVELLQVLMDRLTTIFYSVLSLEKTPIPVQWPQIFASIESRCGIKTFVFNKVLVILENKRIKNSESAQEILSELRDALGLILISLKDK